MPKSPFVNYLAAFQFLAVSLDKINCTSAELHEQVLEVLLSVCIILTCLIVIALSLHYLYTHFAST